MADRNEYTELIAGYHSGRENFTQWVYEITQPILEARQKVADFSNDYDIDLAVGKQLDAIGVRVGVSRRLKTKISDVFFAFDDVDGKGFDFGIWKRPKDSATSITELGDEIYRTILKSKVALNHYGGSNEDIHRLITEIMTAFDVNSAQFSYVDNQDMTISLYIDRENVPAIVWELFYNKILTLNHAGVGLNLIDGVYGVLATTESDLMTTEDNAYLMMDY